MLGRIIAFLACLALAGGSPAYSKSEKAPDKAVTHGAAKTAGKAKAGASGTDAAAAAGAVLAGVLLSDQDRTTITRYFQQHPQPATALPPGIAKNVARGKPIPPGIAKRGVPNSLSGRLSIPSGYELQSVGTDVVLIEAGTRIIADVLKDVLLK